MKALFRFGHVIQALVNPKTTVEIRVADEMVYNPVSP